MITTIIMATLLALSVWLLIATKSALVNQVLPIANVALGTLAARTTLILETAFTALTTPFLFKRVRYFLHLENITDTEGPFIVGIANGDASVGEITTALNEANVSGPESVTDMLTQDNAWVIWWNTVEKLVEHTSGEWSSSGKWISLGKGMPALEASGAKMFIANLDGTALTTGGIIKGLYQFQGVWLRG